MGYEIGQRTYGRYLANEKWFLCAVCGRPTRQSETRVPQYPEPHAGSRVCLRPSCDDQPGLDVNRILAPFQPSPEELD